MFENTSGFTVCVRTGRETAGPSTALRSGRDDNSVGLLTSIRLTALGRFLATELSSRPERSAVEGPAVSLPVLTQTVRHPVTRLSSARLQGERSSAALLPGSWAIQPVD
jgi:hypothetical protein